MNLSFQDKSVLLIDFDGPICSVFSGYPPEPIAFKLIDLVSEISHVPDYIKRTEDPLDVLDWTAGTGDQRLIEAADSAMRAAELLAIETAEPTQGVRELAALAKKNAVRIAIASNNGRECIEAYLAMHGLDQYFSFISARPANHPELMKPHPHILTEALSGLGAAARDAYFVGDSLTDIEAGQRAGVDVIALANKPAKLTLFAGTSAETITDWSPVMTALHASP